MNSPLGEEDSSFAIRPDKAAVGRLDFTASAVDPGDDRNIWIFQPYAIKASTGKGGYRLKVGQILCQYNDHSKSLSSLSADRVSNPAMVARCR